MFFSSKQPVLNLFGLNNLLNYTFNLKAVMDFEETGNTIIRHRKTDLTYPAAMCDFCTVEFNRTAGFVFYRDNEIGLYVCDICLTKAKKR